MGLLSDIQRGLDRHDRAWALGKAPREHEGYNCRCLLEGAAETGRRVGANPKASLGATKPMLGLNPASALVHMSKAFEFGAHGRDANGVQVREKGYGEYNWRNTEISEMVYVHAMERHRLDYLDGQDVASDSKVKHLAHIMACCAILIDAEECGTLVHDRPPKGKAAEVIERMTIKKPAPTAPAPPSYDPPTLDAQYDPPTLDAQYDTYFKKGLEQLNEPLRYGTSIRAVLLDTDRATRRGKGKANNHNRRRKARK